MHPRAAQSVILIIPLRGPVSKPGEKTGGIAEKYSVSSGFAVRF
jgi:hypothetical protein